MPLASLVASAPVVPVTETVGVTRFDDPFRFLEDDGPEVTGWEAALDAEARETLRRLAGYRSLRAAVERHLGAFVQSTPVRAGERWFHVEHGVTGDALRVAGDLDRRSNVLLSAESVTVRANAGIDWFVPSPDGTSVAVGVSCGGDEQSVLHIVSGETGETLRPPIPHVSGGATAWLPDSDALYCLAGLIADFGSLRKELLLVRLSGDLEQVDRPSVGSARRHALQLSPNGRHLALLEHPVAPRLVAMLDRERHRWLLAAPLEPHVTRYGVFMDRRYFAVTTAGAPRGRLVAAPVEQISDAEAWQSVVPERNQVLRAVVVMGRALVLCYFDRGVSRLHIVSADGEPLGEVSLPVDGLCSTSARCPSQYGSVAPVRADADGLTFNLSAVDRSPGLMRYDAASGQVRWVEAPAIRLEGLRTDSMCCSGQDGTEVEYDVVRRGDAARPRPTLMVAYGGWNAMTTSRGYLGTLAPFVEAGGAIVFAHVRGEATFGADRWHAGRRSVKQRSFDDVYAVAEHVVDEGVALRGRIGILGTSNGGLLVGAALTQRPDLFRVAVAVIPLLDMGRFVRDRFGEHTTWEYGDPRLVEDASYLRRYSPYHNVQDGIDYPPTLVVCGGTDVRAPSWHGRKMVAALRRATPGADTALLRVHYGHGHITTGDRAPGWLIAEWLAFVMDRLGLDAP